MDVVRVDEAGAESTCGDWWDAVRRQMETPTPNIELRVYRMLISGAYIYSTPGESVRDRDRWAWSCHAVSVVGRK